MSRVFHFELSFFSLALLVITNSWAFESWRRFVVMVFCFDVSINFPVCLSSVREFLCRTFAPYFVFLPAHVWVFVLCSCSERCVLCLCVVMHLFGKFLCKTNLSSINFPLHGCSLCFGLFFARVCMFLDIAFSTLFVLFRCNLSTTITDQLCA